MERHDVETRLYHKGYRITELASDLLCDAFSYWCQSRIIYSLASLVISNQGKIERFCMPSCL